VPPDDRLGAALARLETLGRRDRADLARYGITAKKSFGTSVASIRLVAKPLGRDHALAAALWKTGWYEARMLAAFVGEAAALTPAQMDRWCRDFDSWALCDTLCFHLFDRSPHAWVKVDAWSRGRGEFVKRAAFALLASLALHDKQAADDLFTKRLRLIERAAADDRNFVKKGVSWALRLIGRRNAGLNEAAVAVARRLVDAEAPAARWVGRDATRELTSPAVLRRLAKTKSRRAR
jgi:3-methyladenine DNA glycosylase AlkD